MSDLGGARYFIAGCGYLGTAVAVALRARGAAVSALTRNPDTAADLRRAGLEVLIAELAAADWHPLLRGPFDGVVNCVGSGDGGTEGYRRSYVEGMESLVRWMEARGNVDRVVYTSSTSVYPSGEGREVDEDEPVGGGERARLLLAAEERLSAASGVRCRVVLRLAGIYGPGREHLVGQVREGRVAGRSETHLNLIHREDAAGAVLAALTAPALPSRSVLNVADDGAATKGAVATWLARHLGLPDPVFTGDLSALRGGPAPDRIIRNRRAKAVLGWAPRFPTFREGYGAFLSPRV